MIVIFCQSVPPVARLQVIIYMFVNVFLVSCISSSSSLRGRLLRCEWTPSVEFVLVVNKMLLLVLVLEKNFYNFIKT
jgi:hypothetical protein